jgi:glycosyltransferase involved in cell wall biosynthesis
MGGRALRVLRDTLWPQLSGIADRASLIIKNTSLLRRDPATNARPWIERDSSRWRSSRPYVSCIVVALSEGIDPSPTLQSIARQTISGIEVLIVVGDGFVHRNSDALPDDVRLVHTQGGAMSGANTAAGVANGKYVCLLTAGDTIDPTCIEKTFLLLEKGDADIAGCLLRELWIHERISEPFWRSLHLPNQPFLIVRKKLWQHLSGVDSKYELYGPWEFLLRSLSAGAIPRSLPELLQHARNESADQTLSLDGEGLASVQRLYETLKSGDVFNRHSPGAKSSISATLAFSFAKRARASSSPHKCILLAMPFLTVGGAERSLSQIMGHLKKRGFRFVVITTEAVDPRFGDTTSWFEESTLEVFHLPRYQPSHEWPDFVAYLLRSREVQILWIAGSIFTYNLLPSLKTDFPRLHVVDILFNHVGMTAHYLKYNYLIDRIIVEHPEMKSWLLERGEREDLISIIPNGVDLNDYKPVPKQSWRELSDLPPSGVNRFTVGFIGRLSPEKAPEVFVAIAEFLRNRWDIEFIVCGEGILCASLGELVEKYKLENIHFLGFVDPRAYLSCCDALIVCSKLDGRPNVVMESLASGVPVIASRVGALPTMVQNGITGFLCDVGDVSGFAASVIQLADQPELHLSMKESARRWAEKHCAISNSIDQYESLFQALISNANS